MSRKAESGLICWLISDKSVPTQLFKSHFTSGKAWYLHPSKQALQEPFLKNVWGTSVGDWIQNSLHPYVLVFPPYIFHTDVSHNLMAYMRHAALQDWQLFLSATIDTRIVGHIDIRSILHSLCLQFLSMHPSLWAACHSFWGAIEAFTTVALPEEYLWHCLNALVFLAKTLLYACWIWFMHNLNKKSYTQFWSGFHQFWKLAKLLSNLPFFLEPNTTSHQLRWLW